MRKKQAAAPTTAPAIVHDDGSATMTAAGGIRIALAQVLAANAIRRGVRLVRRNPSKTTRPGSAATRAA